MTELVETPAGTESGLFLTVYMPAFNEEEGLEHTVSRLLPELDRSGKSYELLIVEDGSSDGTLRLAESLAGRHPEIRVVSHGVNKGIAETFLTALREARGEWILYFAADLAAEPEDLARFFVATEIAPIILGQRSRRHDSTVFRELISFGNNFLVRLLYRLPLNHFTFANMYRTSVVRELRLEYPGSAFFYAEIVIKAKALGHPFAEIPVRYLPRRRGTATGSRLGLIVGTLYDLLHFWVRWVRTTDPRRYRAP